MKTSIKKLLTFPLSLSAFICVHLWLILLTSCGSKPTDLRSLIPADSLVYLETNDLGKALRAVTENEAFKAAAKTQPDFSALTGMKLAVAVTGFETKEEQVTDENSVLNFKPRFVAVVETNAWNYQALSFIEDKLGEFINETYGGEVTLETSDKNGGKYFVWNAQDGRKAFALVRGSLIFFGNDESAIDKCLAVIRGEAESIAKNAKIAALSADSLASGYVSKEGIAQISNIVGLKFAREAGEESEVQSAIAGILPQLLRNSITEISWAATKGENGIEDKYTVSMPSDIANVFSETMRPSGDLNAQQESNEQTLAQLPISIDGATRYNFKDPEVAWRSILSFVAGHLDGSSGKFVAALGGALFEQYGIHDAEMFLRSVGNGSDKSRNIFTAKSGNEFEGTFVLAMSGDTGLIRKSFIPEMKPDWQGEDGYYGMKTTDGDLTARFAEGLVILGPTDQFGKLTNAYHGKPNDFVGGLLKSSASIITIEHDNTTTLSLIEVLAHEGHGDTKVATYYTETRFTGTGIERRTVSDFGLVGSIIAQFGKDN